jgi:D-sedoheptulose 7-phosphate isomerase
VAIAISTSGDSPNVVAAVEQARRAGLRSIGLLGKGGGKLRALVDLALVVPSDDTQRIQEAHIAIGHAIAQLVDDALLAEEPGPVGAAGRPAGEDAPR